MFCKICGKAIEDNSYFCKYCGANLIDEMEGIKTPNERPKEAPITVKLTGEVNQSVSSNLMTRLLNVVQNHALIASLYIVWFVINLILLAAGENENGFWPRLYENHEHTEISWDIDKYGLPEFLVYAILVPFIAILSYKFFEKQYNIKNPGNPNKNKLNAFGVVIFLLFDILFLIYLSV